MTFVRQIDEEEKKYQSISYALGDAIGRINDAERNDVLLNGGEDVVYATCHLKIAKQNINEALEHIRKITHYNEGGDENGRI